MVQCLPRLRQFYVTKIVNRISQIRKIMLGKERSGGFVLVIGVIVSTMLK